VSRFHLFPGSSLFFFFIFSHNDEQRRCLHVRLLFVLGAQKALCGCMHAWFIRASQLREPDVLALENANWGSGLLFSILHRRP